MSTPADLAARAGERIRCRRLVITTGTFLRGVIHIGSQSRPAGRMPSTAASEAAASSAQAPPSAARATDAADETAALAAGGNLLLQVDEALCRAVGKSCAGRYSKWSDKAGNYVKEWDIKCHANCPPVAARCGRPEAWLYLFVCQGGSQAWDDEMVLLCRRACKDPRRARLLLSGCPEGSQAWDGEMVLLVQARLQGPWTLTASG